MDVMRECFNGCTNLTIIPKNLLPATTLAGECYYSMFNGCTSLTEAPELPAINLANKCYLNMFTGCSSLIKAPNLPASSLIYSCYTAMFESCTSLQEAPILSSTNLSPSCYEIMFYNCTSLIQPPELPATTLANKCYSQMFYGCTSLTFTPYLPAETLVSGCYYDMFEGCYNIENVRVGFTNWNDNLSATTDWLKGVAFNGTFISDESLAEIHDDSHIPVNWEVEPKNLTFVADEANSTIKLVVIPTNSSTYDGVQDSTTSGLQYRTSINGNWSNYTLSSVITLTNVNDYVQFKNTANKLTSINNKDVVRFQMTGKIKGKGSIQSLLNYSNSCYNFCYHQLFCNCTSLLTAPKMTATKEIGIWSYRDMFFGCTSLTIAPKLPALNLNHSGSYIAMFMNCTGLIEAPPLLPSKTLSTSCYSYMFFGCRSLTHAPEIQANILTYPSFENMFANCTSLSSINVNFTNWENNSVIFTNNWVNNVSSTGTFIKPLELIDERGASKIPENWNIVKKLDYIVGTGTQYIDTEIVPTGFLEIEVDCQGPINIGCRTGWGDNEFRISSSNSYIDCPFGSEFARISNKNTIKKSKIKFGTDGKFYQNNILIHESSSTLSSQSYSIHIFSVNTSGTPVCQTANGYIYGVKIWRDHNLIMDLIPAKDQNSIVCMYDKVTNTFLYNAGTGNFIAPPPSYKVLNYLESTGTQYITTNYIFDANDKSSEVEIKFYLPQNITSEYDCHFGARGPSNNALYSSVNHIRVGEGINGQTYWDVIPRNQDVIFNFKNGKFSINGVETDTSMLPSIEYGFDLFTMNDNGNHTKFIAPSGTKIYYCKFLESGILVHNYIPILDHNNISCMYDLKTDTYYYNKGTGNFNYELID